MNMKIITRNGDNYLEVTLKNGERFDCMGIEFCDDHIELDDWIEIPNEEVETIIEYEKEA